MIGRKGTTDTLSFLIGVIIFLLIVIPIGIAVYHYMFAQSGMQKTLDLLIERTSDLEDGQKDSIIGYIDNGYILISFEKDQAQFGSTETTFGVKRWTCKGVGDETFTMYWGIKKPSRCGNKACLCACGESGKDIPWVGDWLDLAGPNLCSDGQCVVYDDDKSPRFYGGANCEYGVFIAPGSPTLELNFEKQGQITGICEELPCISQEVSKARDTYNELMEKYDKCKKYNAEDCICEATSIQNMPIDHAIKFVSDGRITTTGFYDEEGQKRTEVSFEDKPFGIYDPVKDEGKQVTSVEIKSSTVRDYWFFETEIDSGPFNYEGKDNIYLYKAKGGFVSFVAGNPDKIKEDKEYCRIKAGAAAEQGEEGSTCRMTVPETPFEAARGQLFGEESTPNIIQGLCRKTCSENEYQIGRRGDYCKTIRCCTPEPDAKCIEAGGACQATKCNLDDFQLPIEGITCPDDKKYCCNNIVGPCAKLGGVCKHPCRENEIDKGKQTDCTTGDDVCCISSISEPVPLGV